MAITKANKLEQNKHEGAMSLLSRSLLTGFIGGILWSAFGVLFYYFNFTETAPRSFFLRSWLTDEWTSTWLGDVVSVLMAGVTSVLAAFIYYSLLKKINVLWIGVLYGVILWGIVFYVLNPVFTNIPPVTDMDRHSIISTICLYSLYGAFVGYSISYDYHDTVLKQVQEKQQSSSR
ncbi:YqhR family membrane protein [Lentibacillus saliphilus]|uniref:YqhR family membrane protein n=1 Tax=Lentibacillus saliphilus TaxID=2737028 RepID=UPI001C301D9F|nr:YqhR family membrane protein [Lentibacillus saliphilus]